MTKTLEISDETYERIKAQLSNEEQKDISQMEDFVGEKLFIRTVTYHLIGKVEKIVGNFFVLSEASWIADSGRFMNAIKEGKLDEVEPIGKAFVNINSIVDVFPWKHSLKQEQK
jgi:hypothetical protein